MNRGHLKDSTSAKFLLGVEASADALKAFKSWEKIMRKLLACCTSRACTVGRFENISNYAVKDVPKTASVCPDCKSALLWKKKTQDSL